MPNTEGLYFGGLNDRLKELGHSGAQALRLAIKAQRDGYAESDKAIVFKDGDAGYFYVADRDDEDRRQHPADEQPEFTPAALEFLQAQALHIANAMSGVPDDVPQPVWDIWDPQRVSHDEYRTGPASYGFYTRLCNRNLKVEVSYVTDPEVNEEMTPEFRED